MQNLKNKQAKQVEKNDDIDAFITDLSAKMAKVGRLADEKSKSRRGYHDPNVPLFLRKWAA